MTECNGAGVPGCPTAQIELTEEPSIVLTFGKDLSFSVVESGTGKATLVVPHSCVPTNTTSCTMLGSNDSTMQESCSGDIATSCTCDVTTTFDVNQTGTYTSSGTNVVVTVGGQVNTVGYCVKGNTLYTDTSSLSTAAVYERQ